MKQFLFIILFFCSVILNAQDKKVDSKSKYHYYTIDAYYANKSFSNSFYNQLNKTENFKVNSPITCIGVGFSDYDVLIAARAHAVFQMFFTKYLENKISIQDTILSKITGYSYHFGIGKILKTKNGRLSVAAYLGFNTGQLKLKYPDGFKQTNTFFSPKISLQPKIMLTKKIGISVIIDYEYDTSVTSWKNANNKNSISPMDFNQTGLSGYIALGYCPFKQ